MIKDELNKLIKQLSDLLSDLPPVISAIEAKKKLTECKMWAERALQDG